VLKRCSTTDRGWCRTCEAILGEISFRLKPIPPFRLDLTAWAIRRRPHNIIDHFDGEVYRRAVVLDGRPVAISVRQIAPANSPAVEVIATGPGASRKTSHCIEAMVDRILGLAIDLRDFYRLARDDKALRPLVKRLRGMKPVRFPTNFEAFTNAVACQLVSLTAGMHVVNRIAQKYGLACEFEGTRLHACAEASDIARAEVEDLRALGLSRPKARYLIGLAQTATGSDRDFSSMESLDDADAIAALSKFAGVGRWTAEYVLLRGLGRFHIFPGDDVGGRNGLQSYLGLGDRLDYEGVRKSLARWQAWGGFIYFHLLVNALADHGIVRA
jgi:DNA-3-methyladenine glycosylase II